MIVTKKDPKINVAKWKDKKKKWVYPFTQVGYLQPTVRKIFSNLSSDNKDFTNA